MYKSVLLMDEAQSIYLQWLQYVDFEVTHHTQEMWSEISSLIVLYKITCVI